MAIVGLRDRDAIVTKEGLIFRVFGYSHPERSYVCDAEYASSKIFNSTDPRAPRGLGQDGFFKFYEDQGFRFIQEKYPRYMIFHEMLGRKVVGVNVKDISMVRKPENALFELAGTTPKDNLHRAMQRILENVLQCSKLDLTDFGVFGSLLHKFYHSQFSDIDLIIYGEGNLARLLESLQGFYESEVSSLRNEFATDQSVTGKNWRFTNLSLKEYLWHQQRKLIYSLFEDSASGRTVKTEFEPVKNWREIRNDYDPETKIVSKGWTSIRARILDDTESPFVPSIYDIEPLEVSEGSKQAIEVNRVVSYLEEFRLQAKCDETVEVTGNLEELAGPHGHSFQITLTYCPRYYEQVLKVSNLNP